MKMFAQLCLSYFEQTNATHKHYSSKTTEAQLGVKIGIQYQRISVILKVQKNGLLYNEIRLQSYMSNSKHTV